ncbi:MAG: TetR/AcrR family transcriptional regulator [Myxococcota bacterium]
MAQAKGRRMTDNDRSGPKADRAAAIKAAAIEVFAEQGYHAAKVSTIVKRVGVAQGTFYLYFKSKQELFGEILQDFLILMQRPIETWDVGRLESIEDYEQSLNELGNTLIPVINNNRELARIFFNEALVSPDFSSQIQEFYEALIALLTSFNEAMHRQGLIRETDFEVMAVSTIGMVERNIQQYIIAPEEPPTNESLQRVVSKIVNLFIFGAVPR